MEKYEHIRELQRRGLNTLHYVPLGDIVKNSTQQLNSAQAISAEYCAVRTEYARELHEVVKSAVDPYRDTWNIECSPDGRIRYPLHILRIHRNDLITLHNILPTGISAIVSEYFDNAIVIACGAAEVTDNAIYIDFRHGGYVREVTHDGTGNSVKLVHRPHDTALRAVWDALNGLPGIYEWSYCTKPVGIYNKRLLFWDFRRC